MVFLIFGGILLLGIVAVFLAAELRHPPPIERRPAAKPIPITQGHPEPPSEQPPAQNNFQTRTFISKHGFVATIEYPEYVPSAKHYKPTPENVGDSYAFMVRGGSKPTRNGPTKRMRLYPLLSEGQMLRFVREPENTADANVVLIYPSDGRLQTIDLGYVPEHVAAWLGPILDRGAEFKVKVTRVVIRGVNGQWPSLYAQMTMTKTPEPLPKRKRQRVRKPAANGPPPAVEEE